jgi:hypothetical protein
MKELRFTLYDIFGYLLPGLMTLVAILLAIWTWQFKIVDFNSIGRLSTNELGFIALVAYFLGHAVQAFGNLVEDALRQPCDMKYEIDQEIEKAAAAKGECRWEHGPRHWLEKLIGVTVWSVGVERYGHLISRFQRDVATKFYDTFRSRFGLNAMAKGDITNCREIFKLCGAALTQESALVEREIHEYREGFYRGAFIALLMMLASLFSVIWPLHTSVITVIIHTRRLQLSVFNLSVVISVCILCVGLSFRRYRKFRRLMILSCFARFVATMSAPELPSVETVRIEPVLTKAQAAGGS